MRFIITVFIFVLLFVSNAAAQQQQQETTRAQKIQELQMLGGKAEALQKRLAEIEESQASLEREVLGVTDADEAVKENDCAAFRIFPRGLLDDKISVRGGAAYYSFTNDSHDYNKTPQIQFENGDLSVGFYGASFGFVADLQETDFSKIDDKTKGVNFLINYRPPTKESDARTEFQKSGKGFDAGGVNYRREVSAIVGHSYILRAVSFDEADTLIAFKIYRKDTDGSLIIFWKTIADFVTPKLEKSKSAADDSEAAEAMDVETANTVQNALVRAGLLNVSVEATNRTVTLRGTVPKGKLAEAIMRAQETSKKPIRNELTEQ